jgi:serine/threonine protein kinase
MLPTKEPNAEPIPGYRLLEPLGRGGFGEVWKCEAPGGLCKAIKFVAGHPDDLTADPTPVAEELKAIQHVKSLRHPFLLSMERVELIGGELVIVMELADKNLQDLFNERREAGLPGIDRHELLGYLREAAEALDWMNGRHGLQHLDVKPGNLFLVSGHVKVADFGLVRSLADRNGDGASASLGALTALYAAPELFRNAISPASDQYSLALVYQQLLTGCLPFRGKNARQLMLQHCTADPDLAPLPGDDRPAVARALARDPERRFPTCTDFVRALEAGGGATGRRSGVRRRVFETRADGPGAVTVPLRPAHAQCLPGYHFRICLGRTPFTEVWDAQAADGGRCLVKFLYGVAGRDPAREREALRRLEALRHPALPSLRVVPGGPGCLALVTPYPGASLRDRYHQARGSRACDRPRGLPRAQLLRWLRPAARALDELARQTGLQHLGLTPRSLLPDGDRLLLADFGVLPLLWQPAGQLAGQLQARYAAPELFENRPAERCDLYSLAVIYQEMLTGTPPWRGRRTGPPNLEPLSEADRAVLARALDADPARRFGACTELVDALEEVGGRPASEAAGPDPLAGTGSGALVAELLIEASGGTLDRPELWAPTSGGASSLRCRFAARLPAAGARARFEGFRRQWNAQVVAEGEGLLTFEVSLPGRFWQRWLGGTPRLLVETRWARPDSAALPQVSVCIRAADKGARVDDGLVRQVGPLLLDSLRSQLEAAPERRGRQRLAWGHPVRASFLLTDARWSEPINAQGKDLSLTGMGLYLPGVPPGSEVALDLTTPTRPEPVRLRGHCVRVQRCPDGRYQAGISFQ